MADSDVDIVIDCHDIELLVDVWAAALGYRTSGSGTSTGCCCPTIQYTHQ